MFRFNVEKPTFVNVPRPVSCGEMSSYLFKPLAAAVIAALSFLPFTGTAPAHALEPNGDFDGDGYSDVAVAHINRKGRSTQWYVQLTSGALQSYSFGAPADGLVTGKFFQDKKTYPGVVLAKSGAPLQWYIKTPGPTDAFLQFGIPGDLLPNQGDLDCDGITDLTIVRNDGHPAYPGFKVWYVALSASATVQEIIFGNNRDGAAIADTNGDHCDELIALREGFHWFSRGLHADEAKVIQWGLPGDIPLLPADLDGDGTIDFIVARDTPGGVFLLIRYGSGEFAVTPVGKSGAVALIGKFSPTSSTAAVNRVSGISSLHYDDGSVHNFSFGNMASTVVRPDGSVVQPMQGGSFFRSASAGTVSAERGYEDAIADGCESPRFPDGANKKRAWVFSSPTQGAGYYIQGTTREVELFAASGAKIDEMILIDPGSKKKRELWLSSLPVSTLSAFAPLTLKETQLNGRCNIIDVSNPASTVD